MGLLNRLFGKKSPTLSWEEVRNTQDAYPKGSFSVFTLETEEGMATGWMDEGYEKYKYKKNCPYNFLVKVDVTDDIGKNNPELDMGTIEDYFTEELRKICVVHIIGRVATSKGLDIQLYLEKQEEPQNRLKEIAKNPDRLVSFEVEINEDQHWNKIKDFIK